MLPLLVASSAVGIWVGRKFIWPQTPEQIRAKEMKARRKQRQSQPIELIREYVMADEPVILATEEVPLDNRFGNRVLISELEFSRTATISLNLGNSQGMSSTFHNSLIKLVQSWSSAHMSRSLGMQVGSQINRSIRLRLSCDPGKMAMYRVLWKQESRRGVLEMRIRNKTYEIPYTMTYGLSHSLESLDYVVERGPDENIEDEVVDLGE
ncbi:MAG: hypothetical protein HQL53_02030 [Magnetococcales bacterium]|nr:hypothetical protein [Magnetococcales bacterium]